MDEKDVQELIKQLSDPNPEVRWNAAQALKNAAWIEQDITPAIPALIDALGDEDADIRNHASQALASAASAGQDITPVIPALRNA